MTIMRNLGMKQLLAGNSENHLLPFFWQHGEDEATLREYMGVIEGSGCRVVCVESRPHPDFCGEKWWEDMDIILDEARKRGMKVWILDDSHFPTGFANGAMKAAPLELHRQSICASRMELEGAAGEVTLDIYGNFPPEFHPVGMEAYILPGFPATGLSETGNAGTDCSETGLATEGFPEGIGGCRVVSLEELVPALRGFLDSEAVFVPESSYLRVMRYQGECLLYCFVNEAAETYRGTVTVPEKGHCYSYDAWANECYKVEAGACEEGTRLSVVLEPRKSLIVLFDEADETLLREPVCCRGERTEIVRWKCSTCEAAAYPDFRGDREVLLPDGLAEEQPAFSGFVRYEASFWVKTAGQQPGEDRILQKSGGIAAGGGRDGSAGKDGSAGRNGRAGKEGNVGRDGRAGKEDSVRRDGSTGRDGRAGKEGNVGRDGSARREGSVGEKGNVGKEGSVRKDSIGRCGSAGRTGKPASGTDRRQRRRGGIRKRQERRYSDCTGLPV